MKQANNTFTGGMQCDLNPITVPDTVLTGCLNGTLLTYNGNEQMLQNDMGNGRVETAFLPEGYIPLGTTSLGGIIYVVSYNPQTDKCQIGSFPSPERNFTSDELSNSENHIVKTSDFVDDNGKIISTRKKIQLTDFILHPGDQFIVAAKFLQKDWYNITNCYTGSVTENEKTTIYDEKTPRYIKFTIATLDSNNRIIDLPITNRYKYQEVQDESVAGLITNNSDYTMVNGTIESTDETDLNLYRSIVSSPYNIYQSKIAGNLYVIADLEVIETFTVNYRCIDYSPAIADNPDTTNIDESTETYTLEFTYDAQPDTKKIKNIKYEDDNSDNTVYLPEDSDSVTSNIGTVKKKFEFSSTDSKYKTFNLIPCMPFGEYYQLQATFNIDFNLIGTGVINVTRWRYYKNADNTQLTWSLDAYLRDNEDIESIKFYAQRYDELVDDIDYNNDEHLIYTVPQRKYYSGIYQTELPFNSKFEENSLYKIHIVIEKKSKDETATQVNDTDIKHKYIYTNGVFNQYYIDNPQTEDFDNVQPELHIRASITEQNENKATPKHSIAPLVSSNVLPQYLRSADIIEYKSTDTLKVNYVFQNDYNTFTTKQTVWNINITNGDPNITDNINRSVQVARDIKSTDQYWEDSDYINTQSIISNSEIEFKDIYTLDKTAKDTFYSRVYNNDSETIKIDLQYLLFNKISGSSINSPISVTNYIAPIVKDYQTLTNYGLQIQEGSNRVVPLNSFYCRGGSSGGGDNEGSGGERTALTIRSLKFGSTGLGWTSGNKILNFDEGPETFMEKLKDLTSNQSLFPVMVVNVGNSRLQVVNPNGDWQINTNYVGYEGYGDDYHQPDGIKLLLTDKSQIRLTRPKDRRGEFFQDHPINQDEMTHVVFWLYMRDERDNLYPTNNIIGIENDSQFRIRCNAVHHSYEYSVQSQNNPAGNIYFGEVLLSLLSQLYVKYSNMQSISGYKVEEYQYYNSSNITYTTTFNYQIGYLNDYKQYAISQEHILFNNISMQTIQDNFDDKKSGCLNPIIPVDNSVQYNYNTTIHLDRPSMFLNYVNIAESASLDTYIESTLGVDVQLPQITINNTSVYTIQKQNDGTYQLSKDMRIAPISSATLDNEQLRITINQQDTGKNILSNNINSYSFYWDGKNNLLKLSSTYIQTRNSFELCFRSGANSDHSQDFRSYSNIDLFNQFNIV